MRHLLVVALLLASAASQAALLGRAPLTPGGTNYQAFYDDALDITWLEPNLANTITFGIGDLVVYGGGTMNWYEANEWISAMNAANYLGASDWRLPFVVDTGLPGCDTYNYTPQGGTAFLSPTGGADCGYYVLTKEGETVYSELAYMYYTTLNWTGCYKQDTPQNGTPCSNLPFSYIPRRSYWTGTEWGPDPSQFAWFFNFNFGLQDASHKPNEFEMYVWAVHDGDPFSVQTVVPIPSAVWLLGGALAGLGLLRRRQAVA